MIDLNQAPIALSHIMIDLSAGICITLGGIAISFVLDFITYKYYYIPKRALDLKLLVVKIILNIALCIIILLLFGSNLASSGKLNIPILQHHVVIVLFLTLLITDIIIIYKTVTTAKAVRELGLVQNALRAKLLNGVKLMQDFPIFVSERPSEIPHIEVHSDELHCLTQLFASIAACPYIPQTAIKILHTTTPGAPGEKTPRSFAIIGSPVNNARAEQLFTAVEKQWQPSNASRQSSLPYLMQGQRVVPRDRGRTVHQPAQDPNTRLWTDYALLAKIPNVLYSASSPEYTVFVAAGCKAGGTYYLSTILSDLTLVHDAPIPDGDGQKIDISGFFFCLWELQYRDMTPGMPLIVGKPKIIAAGNLS